MPRRDPYQFLPITDAMTRIEQKVSIIGIATELTFPRHSRGTDWCCSVRVVDRTSPKHGIVVNVFTARADELPRVSTLGDIVIFRSVVVKRNRGEVNAVFYKKFSAFSLYKGQEGGSSFNPYQFSENFRIGDLDSQFIDEQRNWLIDFQNDEEGLSTELTLLREITEGVKIDLVCKILHVYQSADDEWMALVWDGTDCPPNIIKTKLEEERDNPLPLRLEPFPLPRDILCTFPTVGTILRVLIDTRIAMHAVDIQMLSSGKWVKLLNLSCKVKKGLWCGLLTTPAKVQHTTDNDRFVADRRRLYQERLSNGWGRIPYSFSPWHSPITAVDHRDAPFVTLMDVITYSEVTAEFKCIVRVVTSLPWQTEDFHSPALGVYRTRLTLEDPTARIHAYLRAEDGENFFGGYPELEILTRKRDALLGITMSDDDDGNKIEVPRNPPWVKLCIRSHYHDNNDPWGSRYYQIYDTKLLV